MPTHESSRRGGIGVALTMKLITIILVISMPGLAHAETVEGTARVVDGDTIEIKDQKIRLWGIDAPELAQRCSEDGAMYPCGLDASHALAKQIGRKRVSLRAPQHRPLWAHGGAVHR